MGTKGAPSALVCCWRVIIDRLPTRMNLSGRGVAIGNQICPMCLEEVETTKYLFFLCKVAQLVYDVSDRWTVRHENPEMHLLGFHIPELSVTPNKVWKGMWVAIVSELWSQINKVVFNNGVVDSKKIFSLT